MLAVLPIGTFASVFTTKLLGVHPVLVSDASRGPAWNWRRPAGRRCQPQLRESHARDVVEAVDDAAQVTAVAC